MTMLLFRRIHRRQKPGQFADLFWSGDSLRDCDQRAAAALEVGTGLGDSEAWIGLG